MTQNSPPEVEETEYEEYAEVSLNPRDMWLIVGLNALVSAIISVVVVLVLGPWVLSGAIANLNQTDSGTTVTEQAAIQSTPLDVSNGTPAFTATPSPTPAPRLYTVADGDTLSDIATRFGVSMQDIMIANGFDDPNFITAGQQLLIPIGGLPETPTPVPPTPTEAELDFDPPTPEGTTAPEDITLTATTIPTAIPTATAPPLDQVIIEISNVLGYGQLEQEVVVITNEGPGVNLAGWQLAGSQDTQYEFPNLFLWSGGSVRVHTKNGSNTPSDLYWGAEESRWFSGDTVTLLDSAGDVIASYTIP